MFRYFEKNFSWSFAVSIATEMGGGLNEIDAACTPLKAVQDQPAQIALDHWYRNWNALGDKLRRDAEKDEANGQAFTSGMKYLRSSAYYQTGERLMLVGDERRVPLYRKSLDAFSKGVALSGHNTRRVEIPYGNGMLAGWLSVPEGKGPHPCLIFVNGFDSTKEILYFIHRGISMQRGMATFFVDQGGSGEALRYHNMAVEKEAEAWVSLCVNYLEQQPDIDSERVGIIAVSFGSYISPRAAAYEPRLKCCIAIGANPIGDKINPVDFDKDLSLHEISTHSMWLSGTKTRDEAHKFFGSFTLTDALPRITCPFLVAHGEDDVPIPMEYAQWVIDQAVNSSRAELRKFSSEEGASYHCGIDDPIRMGSYCYDWAAEVLGGSARVRPA